MNSPIPEARYQHTTPEHFTAFLAEAAVYFRKRPTDGEDAAYWANEYNAEACERISAYLESLRAERDQWKAQMTRYADIGDAYLQRAETAEATITKLRTAAQAVVDAGPYYSMAKALAEIDLARALKSQPPSLTVDVEVEGRVSALGSERAEALK